MQEIDLTQPQRLALESALGPMASAYDLIAVYGSRATGKARPGSDVDLVVYGADGATVIAAMRSAVEESNLSIFADILSYEDISHLPLRQEIDRHAKPLFRGRLPKSAAS